MQPRNSSSSQKFKFLKVNATNVAKWKQRMQEYWHADFLNPDLVTYIAFFSDLRSIYTKRPLWDRVFKRILDLAMSCVALVLLFPVLVIAALCIKLTSKGPVLFTQERLGLYGQTFRIFKFRTMYQGSESLNVFAKPMQKLDQDPRSTPVGRFLREWRIDELPQIINIFLGQMSWVGPRPILLEEGATASEDCFQRLAAKPGLTGLWQATRSNRISGEEKLRLDAEYSSRQNIWLDMKLIFLTIPKMFIKESSLFMADIKLSEKPKEENLDEKDVA